MWFRLAALWGCTRDEAQRRCSSREFSEWIAFYQMEPFGRRSVNEQFAAVAATVCNLLKYKGKAFKAADFLPPEAKRQSIEEMIEICMLIGGA